MFFVMVVCLHASEGYSSRYAFVCFRCCVCLYCVHFVLYYDVLCEYYLSAFKRLFCYMLCSLILSIFFSFSNSAPNFSHPALSSLLPQSPISCFNCFFSFSFIILTLFLSPVIFHTLTLLCRCTSLFIFFYIPTILFFFRFSQPLSAWLGCHLYCIGENCNSCYLERYAPQSRLSHDSAFLP